MTDEVNQESKFSQLLSQTMTRRWAITAIVLLTFLFIAVGIAGAVHSKVLLDQEWKELLLLMLGAFIGSYGKIIDYWFSDTDKDKIDETWIYYCSKFPNEQIGKQSCYDFVYNPKDGICTYHPDWAGCKSPSQTQ